ncbi:rodlin [Streptomyces benahoarensis]|uniref:RdlA protein n=1 Tax=Streptomyces benahoarensis TaxID=2595054 RepID=A0A553YWQ3_9ACTN|nr:rodlin [Streptomyces benahoarensis]TSB17808.1 RdlA protein [Streptomyces benahoarensis]TSB33650.1 RdlA protein [Streptomyces benahoarensis]
MIKKVLATTAVAASLVGISATAAPQAMAIGNDNGTSTVNGNGAKTAFGNSTTKGEMSPQLELIQGSLNKPCIGLPLKANVGSLFGFIPIAVQDVNVLSNPQNQQCTENSTQAKGDESLSHILDDIPVLSGNGVGNH